ncbi:MAG TPA: tetratricopeptide repeat protein [Burkholderiaceae bacterium]|nr:tetratricopeptide repeat protein [Burkholderiaceae bacterium]
MKHELELTHAYGMHQLGRLTEALAAYDAVLARDPSNAVALHHSGVVLHQTGQHESAAGRISAALKSNPQDPEAWANLGAVLRTLGRTEESLVALRNAVRLAPQDGVLLSDVAGGFMMAGRYDEALAPARAATAAIPQAAPPWYTLALCLDALGQTRAALEAAERAAALDPAAAHYAGLLAQLLSRLGQAARAKEILLATIARHPGIAQLHYQLADACEDLNQPEAAVAAYEITVRLDPSNGPALSQLIFLRRRLADWGPALAAHEARFLQEVARGRLLLSPFALLAFSGDRALQRRCASHWNQAFARPALPRATLGAGPRLRLGYLSADFHEHPTAVLTAGLFEAHDRERFEVHAFSTGPDDGGPLRARLKRGFDHFHECANLSDAAVAQRIRAAGIDILVDLKGHTAGSPTAAILAWRAAPVQAHYLGFPGTLGDGLADYLIGDAVVTPPEHAADYAEHLVRLPHSYQVNDRQRNAADTPPRAALGLPADAVVLCCFNAAWKLGPEVIDDWAAILAQAPRAVLWLLARGDADPSRLHLASELEQRGVDPARLHFANARPNAEYLSLYRAADLFLDTWPYNAHTTASDALWMGCPVLGIAGTSFAGRVGASLLAAVGQPQLVMPDRATYVKRAVQLATDARLLGAVRAQLAAALPTAPLFDTVATTRALERAYEAMAEQTRSGTRGPIDVAA